MPPRPPRRPPLTHFLSIPLNTPAALPELQSALADLSAHFTPRLLPAAAVRPAATLHLTLGVMSLPTPAHVDSAIALLASLDLPGILRSVAEPPSPDHAEGGVALPVEEGAPTPPPPPDPAEGGVALPVEEGAPTPTPPPPPPPPPPLKITLRDLATPGPPRRATVLYAVPHDATGRLPRFAEHVRARFTAAGLLAPEAGAPRPLLLHATVVNTVYVSGRGGSRAGRVTFDAAEALEWGRGRVFAEEVEVAGVCVCRMGEEVVGGVSRGYFEVGRGVVMGELRPVPAPTPTPRQTLVITRSSVGGGDMGASATTSILDVVLALQYNIYEPMTHAASSDIL
ncbi:hypothetical protein DFP73DRAFT_585128 [Morchella snyderi]|nr:hypothetical protein DFP73DRAFT_585128 [Morchella snyderi]